MVVVLPVAVGYGIGIAEVAANLDVISIQHQFSKEDV